MNSDLFLRHIEKNCGCEQDCLDAAVENGLRKAKNDRLSPVKFLMLAAACVFTFAIIITINSGSLDVITDRYYQRISFDANSSEVINNYLVDFIINIKKNLGGE